MELNHTGDELTELEEISLEALEEETDRLLEQSYEPIIFDEMIQEEELLAVLDALEPNLLFEDRVPEAEVTAEPVSILEKSIRSLKHLQLWLKTSRNNFSSLPKRKKLLSWTVNL